MNKDQALGLLLFLGSIVCAIIYLWLVFLSPWQMLVLQITAFIAVDFIMFILGWIGYTLATTPPPKPIEEIEKEIESVKEEAPPPSPPPPEAPRAETQVRKQTESERELALLNEKLSKLEELYRRGEVEEDAYKRLKDEYESKKRELVEC